jgi:hypothetical protein
VRYSKGMSGSELSDPKKQPLVWKEGSTRDLDHQAKEWASGTRGGGKVPKDFAWATNPKQTQEENTDLVTRPLARPPAERSKPVEPDPNLGKARSDRCDHCGKEVEPLNQMRHMPGVFEGRAYRPALWCDACAGVGPNTVTPPCPAEFLRPDGTCRICDPAPRR